MIQLEGNEEVIEERGYPNPNFHQRKKKKKSKKKCWIYRSFKHLKKSCSFMKCFYCSRYGHTKKEWWRRKINYLLNKIMEECKHKEKKLTRKEKKKEKKKQRNFEMKVIEQRPHLRMHTWRNARGGKMVAKMERCLTWGVYRQRKSPNHNQ